MARAFVIRPFGKKEDSAGESLDFDLVHQRLIGPALEATDLGGGTTGEIIDAGNIREDMFGLILEADLVICDITVHNANVFYELGIRHALRKKRTILIKGTPTADETPFDLLTDRYLAYEVKKPDSAQQELIEMIQSTLRSERDTDSPIFQMLPELPETDTATLQVVPLDFREEVGRARASQAKGWLRLLSEEVRDLRFQWAGLRLVAEAQSRLEDYQGARESWEVVRETYPEDVVANLALADTYQRLYRQSQKPEDIEASDQAIQRVLNCDHVARQDRVAALTLAGRNQKTRWRREFEQLEKTPEQRAAAMNRALWGSYEAYLKAFQQDLNHCYSGLAALQMATIFLELSEDGDSWKDIFDDDQDAEASMREISKQAAMLRAVTLASIEANLDRLDAQNSDRPWIEISKADFLFLTEEREKRVAGAYSQAISPDNPFAWDAARGQLRLFIDLGIKVELAEKVIATIDERIEALPEEEEEKTHLILFAGHRVDQKKRSKPRFPAAKEAEAKKLIRAAVKKQLGKDDEGLRPRGVASAATGADILFHEVCGELEIPTTICLPMPSADFARVAFAELDDWRTRFLDLQQDDNVFELSDREGLPKWLQGTDVDPWERGNRWVLQMALAANAEKVTLVALWDGREEGDGLGGTAHMVQLGRDAGTVYIEEIDAKKLV